MKSKGNCCCDSGNRGGCPIPLGAALGRGEGVRLFLASLGFALLASVYPLQAQPVGCGDGLIGVGEQCDDANTLDGDGCSAVCGLEAGSFPGWTFYDASALADTEGWTLLTAGSFSAHNLDLPIHNPFQG